MVNGIQTYRGAIQVENKHYLLHREDGPAWIFTNYQMSGISAIKPGVTEIMVNSAYSWFNYGLRHRLDGPALIMSNGLEFWYVNGNPIDLLELDSWIKENNYPYYSEWDDNIKTHFKLRFS